MKNILIPTDFTIESLQLIEYALLNFPNTKLNIVLIAGLRLPDTRWAIFHFSQSEQIKKQLSDEFNEAKRLIIHEHKEAIGNITFQLFSGVNSFAFQNFLEQLNADDAVIPQGNSLYCPKRKWFDTTRLIKKNVKNVIEVPVELTKEVSQKKYSIISLFNL
jgi:hypothetical protein